MELMFGKKNTQVIEFWSKDQSVKDTINPPELSRKNVPSWYKILPKGLGQNRTKVFLDHNGVANPGLKTCAPFFDALSFGYVIRLHCDIQVERNGEDFKMTWGSPIKPLSSRSEEIAVDLPRISGFSPFTQAWEIPYGFKVPKGYSVLITNPLNRNDLPTFSTSGIMDADEYLGPGAVPFALSLDFEGVIKAGTPILQIIPFKRDSWQSKIVENPFPGGDFRARHRIVGWYKDVIWKKKDFS
jgi:hypothetical protein